MILAVYRASCRRLPVEFGIGVGSRVGGWGRGVGRTRW